MTKSASPKAPSHLRGAVPVSQTLGLALLCAMAGNGCKTRRPEAKGLLDEGPTSAPESTVDQAAGSTVSAGGRWLISCTPLSAAESSVVYRIQVEGATRESDEPEAIRLSLTTEKNGERQTKIEGEMGRGSVKARGAILLATPSVVLTADWPEDEPSQIGVITLLRPNEVKSEEAQPGGVAVRCQAKNEAAD